MGKGHEKYVAPSVAAYGKQFSFSPSVTSTRGKCATTARRASLISLKSQSLIESSLSCNFFTGSTFSGWAGNEAAGETTVGITWLPGESHGREHCFPWATTGAGTVSLGLIEDVGSKTTWPWPPPVPGSMTNV